MLGWNSKTWTTELTAKPSHSRSEVQMIDASRISPCWSLQHCQNNSANVRGTRRILVLKFFVALNIGPAVVAPAWTCSCVRSYAPMTFMSYIVELRSKSLFAQDILQSRCTTEDKYVMFVPGIVGKMQDCEIKNTIYHLLWGEVFCHPNLFLVSNWTGSQSSLTHRRPETWLHHCE